MNVTLTDSRISAVIRRKGAELISLKNQTTTREYIWEGHSEFWGKHSPVLFPIVGSLKNNCYIYDGTSYELPRHGFARDFEFSLDYNDTNKAVFSLDANVETLQRYPFQFKLEITYLLKNRQLEITYKISNGDSTTMPFSIGAHPAFALHEKFEDYELSFDKTENLTSHQLSDGLLSETTKKLSTNANKLKLSYDLFDNDALVFKQLNSKKITIIESDKPLLALRFEDFLNFGIWTVKNAPFICLEPWLGYSDITDADGYIMKKEGIQLLEPKKNFEVQYSIEIL